MARCLALCGLLLVFSIVLDYRQVAFATCRSITGLGPQSAYGVADPQGRILDGCNLDRAMIPASVLKIATVLSSLQILGPAYRFRTEFFLDSQQNLLIKGYGDPSLVSEEVAAVALELKRYGLDRIGTIFIDDSAFALEQQVPGQALSDNPYDAPIGPLSVNFNALPFVKQGGMISSGESQTPTLALMTELGRTYPNGRHRINICAGGCEENRQMARYSGELFAALLQRRGISVDGYGGRRRVKVGARPAYVHYSRKTLSELSRITLLYSSNFTANLMYLACGAERFGYPATWNKAREAVRLQMQVALGSNASLITQVEGAGLSRGNRVTARGMLHLLAAFQPQRDLLKKEQGVAFKTGTLSGVYTLAGYLPGGNAFVILLNQPENTRKQVLKQLLQQFAAR